MKSKRICLICPRSVFMLDERVFPFLGILQVAAVWEKLGYTIDVLDLSGIENHLDVVKEYFDANHGQLLFTGTSATTPQCVNAIEIAQFIKQNYPNEKLVLGGAHVTLMHTASKRERKQGKPGRACYDIDMLQKVFDILVCGDGEFTIDGILAAERGTVIDVDDRLSPLFATEEQMTEMPFPARHLIDLKNSYKYFIEGKPATSLLNQRGCSMGCLFCSGRSSPYLRKVRSRSKESVIAELRFLHKEYGFVAANFFDDEMNLVEKEMIPLMYAIADLGDELGFKWTLRGFTKAELFNDRVAKAMVTAGFSVCLTGFESGSERILKNIKKNATRDDNTRCVEIAKKHGMKVKALMSLGQVGEDFSTAEQTRQWLLEVQPDFFDLTTLSVFPGSIYWDLSQDEGDRYTYTAANGDKLFQEKVSFSEEAMYYKGIPGSYKSYSYTPGLSASEIVALRDDIEADVRKKLNIPWDPANPARKHEHSMGSSANMMGLPDWILRSTETHKASTAPLDVPAFSSHTKPRLNVLKE